MGAVLWLDQWFALDSAVTGQANQWVLPASKWLRTQGYRFARVSLRLTVVGTTSVALDLESSHNSEAASPIALAVTGSAAPTGWTVVGTTRTPARTIAAYTEELSTENGLRDLLRLVATNGSATDMAMVRVEGWVSLGS
jgi:hypothetical protein